MQNVEKKTVYNSASETFGKDDELIHLNSLSFDEPYE